MIVSVDIETQGLDATKYITGGLKKEGNKKTEIYRNKNDLWNRVLDLGYAEAKRGKVLNVYSHNAQYDTAGYVNLKDKHLVFFSNRPFIWAYRLSSEECDKLGIPHEEGKGKEIIKFLDTWAIFRMSLKKLGDLISLPKFDTPQELMDEQTSGDLSEEKLQEIESYMIRDVDIVLESILFLKKKIKGAGVTVKRLYTINQIAINFLMNNIKKLPDDYKEPIFWDKKKGMTRRTFRKEEIHSAYRGGRVEAFKTGVIENLHYVDCNSLYPFSAIKMRFPNLKSERKYFEPLKTGWEINELFGWLGLSRCIVKNVSNEHGFLPIRTDSGSFYPKKGKLIIGTWTHFELEMALKNGYELIDVEWSVVYENAPNPFTEIFPRVYNLRKSGDSFDDYFYKMMMNASIGKMAQHRVGQEIVIDNVEKCESYLEKKYKVVRGLGTDYLYRKTDVKSARKNYYMPIVPCLINGWARCYMFSFFQKIPLDDLVYTDTDSCLFLNNHFDKFPIGEGLGEFKIEHRDSRAIIYGRKTYSIGDEIKISGISQRDLTLDDFEKGYVTTRRMVTIKTTNDTSRVGSFVNENRNLNEQELNHNEIMDLLNQEDLLIDMDIEDITYFSDVLVNL
jgi:hypothetical protein